MMAPDVLLALSGFAFIGSITPGPNNLMLMTSGINFGFRRTIPHMLGVGIGFTVMILAVGLGMAGLLRSIPGGFAVIRIASIIYMLFLAWKLARSAPPPAEMAQDRRRKPINFIQALLFQWVNPKGWAMALTAISAYTPKADPAHGAMVIALVFGMASVPSICIWALLGVKLKAFLNDPARQRVFNIGAALALLATLYPIVA